jgi:hypothetical protein
MVEPQSTTQKLKQQVDILFEQSRELKTTVPEILAYINSNISKLFDVIAEDSAGLTEFWNVRQEYNKKIAEDVMNIETKLNASVTSLNREITVKRMSSYPCTNLPGDSDIDFGILVANLDSKTSSALEELFLKEGYSVSKRSNPDDPVHSYLELDKKIIGEKSREKILISLKVRDSTKIQTIIKLHDILDNLDQETVAIITYGKKLLKDSGDKKSYNRFKILVFESYSSSIQGESLYEY